MTNYRNGDFLTIAQIADKFGLSGMYLQKLTGPTNAHRDAELFRLRVETDETYRDAFGTNAKYVYPWEGVKAWYRDRQERSWVQGAAKRG